MATKEEVLAKAKELQLELTDAQVDEFVKLGKMPEKETQTGTRVEELVEKYSKEQLANMLIETRTEAKDRRHENRDLKTQNEGLMTELGKNKELITKYPELEGQLKSSADLIKKYKDDEKSRRVAAMSKLDKDQVETLSYLSDVDAVPAAKFDATISLLIKPKSDGMNVEHNREVDGYAGKNPFAKESLNIMAQIELKRTKPELAAKLEAAAQK